MLATASTDKTVRLWAWPGAAPRRTLAGHKSTVTSVAWAPDGTALASGSYDATVRLWPLDGGDAQVLKGHPKNVSSVTFTPDGRRLVSAGLGADIIVWDVAARKELTRFPAHREAVGDLRVLPGERSLLSMGHDGTLNVWDFGSWKLERTVDMRHRALFACALAPDGSYLAATMDYGVCLLDARTFEETALAKLPNKGNYAVAVSPDGRTLATTAADGKLRVWKVG
ncbi:MAG: WD40 repeat domain-containing protein [SAR202 cluster bacterium]|nr:WD40 repeat domain-containing protein [SAR202 cluster bacterium]